MTIYCQGQYIVNVSRQILGLYLKIMEVIPNLPTVFATFLIECRERHDYSQRKLAARIGCSRSYIAFLEDGTHLPTINTFMLLADAFGMTPAEFQAELDERLRAHNAPARGMSPMG